MSLKISYNTQKILFEKYLKSFEDTRLTFREAEIVACVVNNRGDKKIANIISISPKTVNSHTHNVMQKLKCHSKDGIIDFIESSGRLRLFKQYYLILLIKNAYRKQLERIAAITGTGKQYNIFYSCSDNQEQIEFYQTLKEDLAIVNINILTEFKDNNGNALDKDQMDGDYTNIINSLDKDQYYFEAINLVSTIIDHAEIIQLNKEFSEYYLSIIKSAENINLDKLQTKAFSSRNKVWFAIIIFITLILALIISYLLLAKNDNNSNIRESNTEKIHHNLSNFIKDFSTDNLYKPQQLNNFNLIIDLEKTIEPLIAIKSDNKIDSLEFTDRELVNAVYILSALSNYYLFNKRDWHKSREVLLLSNDLIQSYINKRLTIPLKLNKLNAEELYQELSIVKDLPEVYTHVLYFLGRTYIYENSSIENGLEYFDKVDKLGKKLNLFDSYLSNRSGIGIIKLEKVKLLLNNNANDPELKSLLLELIELYKKLKKDGNSYIIDYKPRNENQNHIIPSQDLYNQVECTQRIIQGYKYLLSIESDQVQKNIYANTILDNFLNEAGLLTLISNSDFPSRKIAIIYNLLGSILLEFYENEIEFTQNKLLIAKKLNLDNNDDILDLIFNIFVIGKKHSRNIDFTKADSYNGMIEVISRKLARGNLTNQQELKLKNDIVEYTKKRDEINQSLKRQ